MGEEGEEPMKPTVQGLMELAKTAVGDCHRCQADWLERQLEGCKHEPTRKVMEMALSQLRLRAARCSKEAKR